VSTAAQKSVAAVFLARRAEGEAPLRSFVETYRRHPAGMEHDLVVLYKGFDGPHDRLPVPHQGIEVSDAGLDIGAYLTAARQLPHRYLCFLNTFAELAADGWLVALHRFASQPGVGIAGAMGSMESLHTTLKLSHKVRWLCNEAHIPYNEPLDRYFEFVTAVACKRWRGAPMSMRERIVERAKTLGWRWRAPGKDFEQRWQALIAPGGHFAEYAKIPSFPNPHIRTNVFMIERQRLLDLGYTAPATKIQACLFESGRDGLTATLRRSGLAAIVVGKDRRGFDVPQWIDSNTYRLGDQANLLATDNQTRRMAQLSPAARFTFSRLAWGDSLGAPPADYPAYLS
jgi:hypothetical protein